MISTENTSPIAEIAIRPYANRLLVLPFENLGSSPEDGRLARGFWQDVIAELARFPALGVIAARSALHASTDSTITPDHPTDIDYLVSGSIRRSGSVIRVTAQLLEARTSRQIWADRYDRPEEDVFAIQDDITARVANALHARIDQQNLAAARRRAVTALAAYEAWLRGFECLQRGSLAADEEGRLLFQQALEIDPQFARGYAGLSLSYFNEWSCSAWHRWDETERKSFDFARQAEALDPNDQVVQLILGRIEQYRRRFTAAEHHFQRALALAPNDAESILQLAAYFAYQGQAELAIDLVKRSLDLNPLCPYWLYPYALLPYFAARRYEDVIALAQKTPLTLMVDLPAFVGAAFAYLGKAREAADMMDTFDREFRDRIAAGRDTDAEEQIQWLRHVNPYRRESDAEHFIEGILRAQALQKGPARPPSTAAMTAELNPESSEAAVSARLLPWPIANMFRKEGVTWTICYEHRVVQMPELKGFRDIAFLLGHPDEDIHCLALAGRDETSAPAADLLDERARREYQTRIRELRAEVEEATEASDCGRAARAQEELDALVDELGRATGIAGRSRKIGDPAERARSAVTWRIRNAVKKLSAHHPALGRHLSNSLQTGVFCRYSPEKPSDWEV